MQQLDKIIFVLPSRCRGARSRRRGLAVACLAFALLVFSNLEEYMATAGDEQPFPE